MPFFRKQSLVPLAGLFVIVAMIAFFIFIYAQVRDNAIKQLNSRQSVYARLAANAIETYFEDQLQALLYVAQNEHVEKMDRQGRSLLHSIQEMPTNHIQGIKRFNAEGIVTFSVPAVPGLVGQDLSEEAQVRQFLAKREPIISEVYLSRHHFKAVALYMPVFRQGQFDGAVAFLISFDELAQKYLKDVMTEDSGFAWLISKEGIELYCPFSDHVGASIFDNAKDFPDVLEMASRMTQRDTGAIVYTFYENRKDRALKKTKYHAVFLPVELGNTFWSIAVATPEDAVLAPIVKMRNQLILLCLILMGVFAGLVYWIAQVRSRAADLHRRSQMEKDLLASAREVQDLYHHAPCGYHSIDADGRIVRMNDTELRWLGYRREELIGKPYRMILSEDSIENYKDAFSRLKKDGAVTEVEYRMKRKDGSTFPALVTASALTDAQEQFVMTRSMVVDVTQRRAQEERLRESELIYRTALETTSDGITIADVQSATYLYVNARLMHTLGRPGESMIGQSTDVFIFPDDIGLGPRAYQDRKATGAGASYYRQRAVKPDGALRTLAITAADVTYRGRPAVISFVDDITEQERAEAALKESEALYRTALETTNDGITIIQDGKYVYANRRLLKTIGREEEGIVGKPLGIYMPPDDQGVARTRNEARGRGEEVASNYDLRVVKPDGSTVIINLTAVAITYAGSPATLTFIKDVTEQKKAQAALEASEEKYRTIIESIEDDYFETDLEGKIIFVNKTPAWLGRDTMIGMHYRDYTTPEMAARINDAFHHIFTTGKPSRITDYEVLHRDGHVVHLEIAASLIRDAAGRPVGFRGISRDVSDRFKMEEEHRKLMAQLYQAQKMEAIGTLAGGVAHDFNNLLTGIQGYISLMFLDVEASHPHYEPLKMMQTLVQSGSTLTKQMLGFARAGRYEVKSTNLNDLIAKTATLFGRTRKEISIIERYTDDLWSVEIDRGQIEQVLLNLFVNAWQAMPGGGSLYLETQNVFFDAACADLYNVNAGCYVKVSVTDTGVGMDENIRQRIFDPFFTTKDMGHGSGLGLASAYGILKGHAGAITVYSEKGHGATFHFYLPATRKEVEKDETVEFETTGGSETILLVDDEEVITEVTGRLLGELGYTILVAESGEAAVDLYRAKHAQIDLVILDMIMPGLSGSEVFDQIKAINPSVRVILSSGYSINGNAQAILKKGARVFLQKPYRVHELTRKIREALAG